MYNATRDDIINFNDADLVPVEIPYWKNKKGENFTIYISQLKTKEADIINNQDKSGNQIKNNMKLIVLCCCDENGNKMFTDKDVDPLYENKSAASINFLIQKILEINFMSKDDIEKIAKN